MRVLNQNSPKKEERVGKEPGDTSKRTKGVGLVSGTAENRIAGSSWLRAVWKLVKSGSCRYRLVNLVNYSPI